MKRNLEEYAAADTLMAPREQILGLHVHAIVWGRLLMEYLHGHNFGHAQVQTRGWQVSSLAPPEVILMTYY